MNLTGLIRRLVEIHNLFGDLPIVGGYLHDDTPLRKVTLINDKGIEDDESPTGIFLE